MVVCRVPGSRHRRCARAIFARYKTFSARIFLFHLTNRRCVNVSFVSLWRLWIQSIAEGFDMMFSFSSPSYTTMPRSKRLVRNELGAFRGTALASAISSDLFFLSLFDNTHADLICIYSSNHVLCTFFNHKRELVLPLFIPFHPPFAR